MFSLLKFFLFKMMLQKYENIPNNLLLIIKINTFYF